ncbi:class I SAM-dependent methyltransferase [Candidatus Woesearchaeota archaeon]|nr:class I SAM-dependent methyltransferase [Candidatus Woesearchaeota archaeon]
MTNVKPEELNYDHYASAKYDDDIVRAIPGHKEMHDVIERIARQDLVDCRKILELGVGTGITTERIHHAIPEAEYAVVDFSETMLEGARKRLSGEGIDFILGDYSMIDLPRENDLIVSVIGIHHQETDDDKKMLFNKIYHALKPDGAFLFGDLFTSRDKRLAAYNDAMHYHHMVENAKDHGSLAEWAYHHKYLNALAAIEDQISWLKETGFKEVDAMFKRYNTALIYARK